MPSASPELLSRVSNFHTHKHTQTSFKTTYLEQVCNLPNAMFSERLQRNMGFLLPQQTN